MTHIEEQVIQLIKSRAWAGKYKYGVGMDRSDLSIFNWLQHLQEELTDAAIYVEKLKEMQRAAPAKQPGQAFAKGDRVRKVKGYKFPGVVVAAFTTLEGNWRYVVQCTADEVAGMLHIYNGEQLEAAGEEGETCESSEPTIPDDLKESINNAQIELRAWNYRLKNKIGSEEAAHAGIANAVAQLRELEKLL